MKHISRSIEPQLQQRLEKGRSILLLGPRQTGKTTLMMELSADFNLSFINPRTRLRYEKDPSLLLGEVANIAESLGKKPLVILDEVQKVPSIMDVVQGLIDSDSAQFILTGSSARKLKRDENMNLLPGRVIPMFMDPLSYPELADRKLALEDLLTDGSLPRIVLTELPEDRDELLEAYVAIYLEEEVRMESIVRKLANFSRFLELAAAESGNAVNYLKLSRQVGVAHTTISGYYQILEDCLVAERIEPFLKTKTRRKLTKSQKYVFFDLGVRRIAAGEGKRSSLEQMGRLFEQFVGLELIRTLRFKPGRMKLRYWRDLNGVEVDWIVDGPDTLIPIEVKWTDSPRLKDAKHLAVFLDEYEEAATGYIVCRTPRRMKLADNIYAIPWQDISTLI
jgi:predicted AAA+ superfamily ATPase